MRWKDWDKDGMFRHGLIVLFFTHGAGVANLLFHVVMGRTLSPAEYGTLVSMLSVFLLVATPLVAVSNTLAHYSGHLCAQGRPAEIKGLIRTWLKYLLLPGVPAFVAMLLLRHVIAQYFHLQNAWPVVALSFTLITALIIPVLTGSLQGLQAFVWMSVTGNAWGVIRLLAGSLLVWTLLPNSVAGLASHALGNLASIGLGAAALMLLLPRSKGTPQASEGTHVYFFLSLAALGCFSVLMNADMAMVKHFFSRPEDYGIYARASTLARTMIFVAQPLAVAMFPKVISRGEQARSHAVILLKAMLFAGLIVGAAALFCSLFPELTLLALFKVRTPDAQQVFLVRAVTWAMAPRGLAFMLMNYELAQNRFFCLIPLALSSLGFVGGVSLFHRTLPQVALVLGVVSTAALVSLAVITLMKRSEKTSPQNIEP
ncbi:MAG: hypothetical protein V2A34_05335 [Lentisphaerota bacterium]